MLFYYLWVCQMCVSHFRCAKRTSCPWCLTQTNTHTLTRACMFSHSSKAAIATACFRTRVAFIPKPIITTHTPPCGLQTPTCSRTHWKHGAFLLHCLCVANIILLRISVDRCVPVTTEVLLHESINMPKQKNKKKRKTLQRMPALTHMHSNSSHRWLHQVHTMCNSVICAGGLWCRSKHEATKWWTNSKAVTRPLSPTCTVLFARTVCYCILNSWGAVTM